MISNLMHYVVILGAIATTVVAVAILVPMRRRNTTIPLPRTPRYEKAAAWRSLPLDFALLIAMVVCLWNGHRATGYSDLAIVVPLLMVLLMSLASAVLPYDDDDTRRNYVLDPGHCGRCEYDLTGNVSGICPECGWQVPAEKDLPSDVGWTFWWRRWRVERVSRWRHHLIHSGILAISLAAMAAFQVGSNRFGILLALLFGAGAMHHVILVMRLIQFRLQHGGGTPR